MKKRYSRNRIYVREDEQELIKSTKIFLGGAGIGSIIAEDALRFGFENITVVAGDKVEISNFIKPWLYNIKIDYFITRDRAALVISKECFSRKHGHSRRSYLFYIASQI